MSLKELKCGSIFPTIVIILEAQPGLIGTTTPSSTTTDEAGYKTSKFSPLEAIAFCPENERIKHRQSQRRRNKNTCLYGKFL